MTASASAMVLAAVISASAAQPWATITAQGSATADTARWTLSLASGSGGDHLLVEKATWRGGAKTATVATADSATCPAIAGQLAQLGHLPHGEAGVMIARPELGAVDVRIVSAWPFAGQRAANFSSANDPLGQWLIDTDQAMSACWTAGGTRPLRSEELQISAPAAAS